MQRITVLLVPSRGAYRDRALKYPVEMFAEAVELEPPTSPTDSGLSDYPTIGGIADFVYGALTAQAA